jgi:DNA-binding NarL/FixJ family response regulator
MLRLDYQGASSRQVTSVASKRIKVLIVDDQLRARRSLQALLATCPRVGSTEEAQNGREALEVMRTYLPDMVLMDVRMPDMDGLEATRQIHATWPQARIVVVSMYPEYREAALAAGAERFLTKGEAVDQLISMLEIPGQRTNSSPGAR